MGQQNRQPIDRFIDALRGYANPKHRDTGALADLRRGFSKATAHRAWPYLAPWCDLMDNGQRAVWLTIAAGFATLTKTTKNTPVKKTTVFGTQAEMT
mgnify:CR=1 FL=1